MTVMGIGVSCGTLGMNINCLQQQQQPIVNIAAQHSLNVSFSTKHSLNVNFSAQHLQNVSFSAQQQNVNFSVQQQLNVGFTVQQQQLEFIPTPLSKVGLVQKVFFYICLY